MNQSSFVLHVHRLFITIKNYSADAEKKTIQRMLNEQNPWIELHCTLMCPTLLFYSV
jgi:hypothetical protein